MIQYVRAVWYGFHYLLYFKGTLFEAILNTEILRGTEVVTSDNIEGIEENLKDYFNYKWENDKNIFLLTDKE